MEARMAEKKTSINQKIAAPAASNTFTPPSEKNGAPPKIAAPAKVRILTGEGWRRVKLKEKNDKK